MCVLSYHISKTLTLSTIFWWCTEPCRSVCFSFSFSFSLRKHIGQCEYDNRDGSEFQQILCNLWLHVYWWQLFMFTILSIEEFISKMISMAIKRWLYYGESKPRLYAFSQFLNFKPKVSQRDHILRGLIKPVLCTILSSATIQQING